MDIAPILDELQKRYELSENEIAIVRLLAKSKEKFSAKNISKQAGIPMGRIYEFLNELMNKKLINKTDDTPAQYNISNFEQKIYDFLNLQFELQKKKHLAVLSVLEKQAKPAGSIRFVRSGEELIFETIRQTELGERFKVILLGFSVPYFFYPEDKDGFIKMRNSVISKRGGALTGTRTTPAQILMNESFNRRHHAKKRMEIIISAKSVQYFIEAVEETYGKKFAKDYFQQIKENIKRYNIEVYISKRELPYYMVMSDKNFIIATRSEDEVVGIVFESPEAADLSGKLFDHLTEEGKKLPEAFDKFK